MTPGQRVAFALSLFLSLSASTDEQQASSGVHSILSFRHLNETVHLSDYLLIAFTSTACSKSRALVPNLEWAASRMKEDSMGVKIARVDMSSLAESADEIKSLYQVSESPALKWVEKGLISGYDGPSSANGIFEWIHRWAYWSGMTGLMC